MFLLSLFILFHLLIIINNQAIIDSLYSCDINQNAISSLFDENCFQTPPKNDILGNYKSSYQDMHYIVGYAQLKYFDNQKNVELLLLLK